MRLSNAEVDSDNHEGFYMNPENVTASTFIELRDGKIYEGVIFRISEGMVLLRCREDGDTFMIPVTGGLQITGFFLDLQLKELKLELFMDDPEDCQTLFKSYNVPITNLVPSNPDIKYVGHLHLQSSDIEKIAKSLPREGAVVDILVDVFRQKPDLLDNLSAWQFDRIKLR